MAALAIAQDEKGWLVDRDHGLRRRAISACRRSPSTRWRASTTCTTSRRWASYKLTVCTNLPCALSGRGHAAEYLKQKLGIDFNETTADGRFTLKEGECMGACGDAPVLLVNNKRMCSFMPPEAIDALLDELRSTELQVTGRR